MTQTKHSSYTDAEIVIGVPADQHAIEDAMSAAGGFITEVQNLVAIAGKLRGEHEHIAETMDRAADDLGTLLVDELLPRLRCLESGYYGALADYDAWNRIGGMTQ